MFGELLPMEIYVICEFLYLIMSFLAVLLCCAALGIIKHVCSLLTSKWCLNPLQESKYKMKYCSFPKLVSELYY